MRSPVGSLLLVLLGGVVGAGLAFVCRRCPEDGTDRTSGVATHPSAPDAGLAGAGPRLEGHDARTLDGLQLSPAESAWLREKLLRERERIEAARPKDGDSGLQVLERVLAHGADPTAYFVGGFEKFRDRVRSSDSPPTRVVPAGGEGPTALPKLAGSTVVIELGAGTFRLEDPSAFWGRLPEETSSVELRGAGRDATTLVGGHHWAFLQSSTRPAGRQVVLRDLTFDGEPAQGSLLDLRDNVEVRLERVRARGWHPSGHAAAIGVSGRTYLVADDCEFDGGGRTTGWAISLRGPSFVWCRGCVFSDLGHAAVIASGEDVKGGHVRLEGCTFLNSRVLERETSCPVEVRGGQVQLGADRLTAEERAEHWGRAWLTASEGVTFGPRTVRCRLGDLLEVLRLASVPDAERVTRLELEGLRDGRPSRFTLETRGSGRSRNAVYTLVLERGRVDMTLRPQAGGHHVPDESVLTKAPSLRSTLEHAAVDADVAVRGVEYGTPRRRGDPEGVVVRVFDDHNTYWDLDPATGAVVDVQPRSK